VVGTTPNGNYTPDKASFIYTVLALCSDDGASSTNIDSVNFNQDVEMFGGLTGGSGESYFGLTETQAQEGVVVTVPPECLHWYVDAATDYDTYASGYLVPLNTYTFPIDLLDGIEGLGGHNFVGTDCGGPLGANCQLSETALVSELLPYDLALTGNLPAAIAGAEQVFTTTEGDFQYLVNGCGDNPPNQIEVFSPAYPPTGIPSGRSVPGAGRMHHHPV
jgi:hypothetical protein